MEAVRRTTCVFAVIAMMMYSAQGFAQNKSSRPSRSDENRQRVSEALARSKRITVRVNDPRDLSGAGMEKEATGVVKSVTAACFQLEYTDRLDHIRKDCIPYGDATLVKWHTKALHILRLVGEDTAIIVLLAPIVIPVVIIAGLLGHPLDC
jgi:hypothetical protein